MRLNAAFGLHHNIKAAAGPGDHRKRVAGPREKRHAGQHGHPDAQDQRKHSEELETFSQKFHEPCTIATSQPRRNRRLLDLIIIDMLQGMSLVFQITQRVQQAGHGHEKPGPHTVFS